MLVSTFMMEDYNDETKLNIAGQWNENKKEGK